MKIVFYNRLNRLWLQRIEELRNEFNHVDFVTEQEQVKPALENANALVAGGISLELIQRAQRLEMIFVPFAGVDGLPLDYVKERGVKISNAHGNAPYVAERSIAMALAFYGKVIDYHNDLKESRWHGFAAQGGIRDTWDSIRGRACAIIGTGEIGKQIAKLLNAFDCRVIGFKKRPVSETPEHFDEITLNLDEALQEGELIFICLPLTEQTKGMFSAEVLAGLKGKFLVNVGRGGIVDEEGLYRALKDGILKGAGIDVWYGYPEKGEDQRNPSKYPIYELPNVLLSPHVAGFTSQAATLNIEQTIENIRAYLKTGKPVFEVNADLMY
ncbi:MAG TPA: 2-hydroxyacid dehydrogenase [Desulfatiglandales bacterium]|nr:2-hydroxyacid dehydrogenase [Desulfatiglandales bacterium]